MPSLDTSAPVYFITGATGMIGSEFVAETFTRQPNAVLYLLVRADNDHAANLRVDSLMDYLCDSNEEYDRLRPQVHAVRGCITQPMLGMSQSHWDYLVEHVNYIANIAASTAWHLPLETSRKFNVNGTKEVLKLSAAAQHLTRLIHVSTAFVVGTDAGHIYPDSLNTSNDVCDTYQESKREAEALVREAAKTLPVTIVRPATVVGCSSTGRSLTFDTLYFPLKMLLRGQRVIFMVDGKAPFDIVSSDWVAKAMFALMTSDKAEGGCFHTTAGASAPRFSKVMNRCHEAIQPSNRTAKSVLMIPSWTWNLALKPALHLVSKNGKSISRKLELFDPYIKYKRTFDNSATLNIIAEAGVEQPKDLETYLPGLVSYAIDARWGRR